MKSKGKVHLIGAGPGDPELLTRRDALLPKLLSGELRLSAAQLLEAA